MSRQHYPDQVGDRLRASEHLLATKATASENICQLAWVGVLRREPWEKGSEVMVQHEAPGLQGQSHWMKKHWEINQPYSQTHPQLVSSSTQQTSHKVLVLGTFMEFQVKTLPILGSPLNLQKESLLFL